MKTVSALCAALALSSIVMADESTPAPLAQALANEFEAPEDAIWRYTLEITRGDERLVAHFDGAQTGDARWTLIYPQAPDAMSDAQRERWESLIGDGEDEPVDESDNADGDEEESNGVSISFNSDNGLFFRAESVDMIGGTVRETGRAAGAINYSFDPYMGDSDEDRAMGENLNGEVIIDAANPYIRRVRMHAPESFKPHPVARVHAFEMVLEYDWPDDFPAPVIRSIETDVDFSAMFQRRRQSMRLEFSDVEYITP